MLLLIPVAAALIVALLHGGSPRHLAAVPIRGGWLIMASFAIQLLLYTSALRHSAVIAQWNSLIYLAAISLALIGALRNWHLGTAVRIATLGVALNATVIVLNGGHMPVNAAAMRLVQSQAKVHDIANTHLYGNTRLASSSSRMLVLSDIIPVRMPGGHGNVYSIGDVLLCAGVSALMYRATRGTFSAQDERAPQSSASSSSSSSASASALRNVAPLT